MGTPDEAVPSLRSLVSAGVDVALVVSRPDVRRSRRAAPSPSPVKAAALDLGLPVDDDLAAVPRAGVDLGVVVAYGQIIPTEVLASTPMVNLHFSLLPRWRGAAPVERAILAGDRMTGVCVMAVEPALDTGPVFRRAEVAIGARETAGELRARLASLGAGELVAAIASGLERPVAQAGEPTYAKKLSSDELRISWADPAGQIDRLVRVGGAWSTFRGARLKVLRACPLDGEDPPGGALEPGELAMDVGGRVLVGSGRGVLELVEVQAEGRGAVAALSWWNGARPADGEVLGA